MQNKYKAILKSLLVTILLCEIYLVLNGDRIEFFKKSVSYEIIAKASYEVKHTVLVSKDTTIGDLDTCQFLLYHYQGSKLMSNHVDEETFNRSLVGETITVKTYNTFYYLALIGSIATLLCVIMVFN
jgi:hypothetical protein